MSNDVFEGLLSIAGETRIISLTGKTALLQHFSRGTENLLPQ